MAKSPGTFTHALSIDIGGTFTDFSLLDLRTGEVSVNKVLTDAEAPERALMAGAREALAAAGVGFEDLAVVVHSTTLAANAIIQRQGARTALLTTRGFRDVLEMGREQMYEMYDLTAQFPPPIVPRYLRRELTERVSRDGEVLQPLDEAEVVRVAGELAREGVEAVAVSLLHSYNNPVHERRVGDILAARFPKLALSLSSEVAPVINEYERTSTTAADCFIKPAVARYLKGVEALLSEAGYGRRLLVMLSEGGVMGSEWVREHPVRLLESGPAAGALAGGFYGGLLGEPSLISLDMGGTTAKTCVIEGTRPPVVQEMEVARLHRFKKGSGLPIAAPVVDLLEIGSGGGSVAWVNNLGLLQVGPQSAGASPGPACYGAGGREPTVTDADLLLGYLSPDYFLGGRMRLDANAAREAMARLAASLRLGEVETAWGVYRVVTENMASAARIHIIERNKDPRAYALIAFGGAGPVHACEVARTLGIRRVVAPLAAGVTSALGCLTAPLSFEETRSLPRLLRETDWSAVAGLYGELETRARAMMTDTGVAPGRLRLVRSADMRLAGQIHEIRVPVPDGPLGAGSVARIEADFHATYQEMYSRRNLSVPPEVRNWRLRAEGPSPSVRLRREAPSADADPGPALKGTRPAYFQQAGGFTACPVYDRYLLRAGSALAGPAIVEERESTAVVGPADRAVVDEWLNLIIHVG